MEEYLKNYDNYKKVIIYDFKVGYGGIGDLIKFFMFVLNICIKNNIKLKYLVNNIPLEKYLSLKHPQMYIKNNEVNVTIVSPFHFYNTFNYNDMPSFSFNEVFIFSDEVISNCKNIININSDYISFHLRLGDSKLETDKKYIVCPNDKRTYDEEKIFKAINKNKNNSIIFFCDNNQYKLKIKSMFENVLITNCNIGHTSLTNTTEQQTLDALTEFYLLCNSKEIFACSQSGFSIIASRFKNIPIHKLY